MKADAQRDGREMAISRLVHGRERLWVMHEGMMFASMVIQVTILMDDGVEVLQVCFRW